MSNPTSQDDGTWKHYRLGAVYLNFAEAAAESGHLDEAMKYVNKIRHRAGFSTTVDVKAPDKKEAVLWYVMKEGWSCHMKSIDISTAEDGLYPVKTLSMKSSAQACK